MTRLAQRAAPDARIPSGAAEPTERPVEPAIHIRPPTGLSSWGLREAWQYRELLYFLTWRDVKVRYKQTVLGFLWAVLQPVLTMVVFTVFFGRLAGVPSDGAPYPIFVFAGLLPWTFFQNAVTTSGNSLVASTNLVSKIYFPRLLIPTAAVAAALVDLLIASAVLGVLMSVYQVPLTAKLLALPVAVAFTTLLAVAVGLIASALNVWFRDVRYALPFVIQLWLFVSPVIYPVTLVPEAWRWLLALNPMTGLIELFRFTILGQPLVPSHLLASGAMTVVLLMIGLRWFHRVEAEFADVI